MLKAVPLKVHIGNKRGNGLKTFDLLKLRFRLEEPLPEAL